MNDIIADIDMLLTEMETDFYRVCVFGSARIQPGSVFYSQCEELAEGLAKLGADVVTGGGPGLMEAANKGAKKVKDGKSRSIGLPIDLPFETDSNIHLDVKSQHKRFSSCLDEFMRIFYAVIITPGGIGTLLELFFTWQLIQVEHIRRRPFILLGPEGMWSGLIEWIEKWPLNQQLMSSTDMEALQVMTTVDDVLDLLRPDIEDFYKRSKSNKTFKG